MKRIFIIIFCISTLFAKSQILSWNTTPINCFTDTGTISLETMVPSPSLVWSFEDDLLGWISADTMQDIQFSINFDTLSTLRCGAYKVVANGGQTVFVFVGCPLGSRGEHFNIECFGDSTGMIKRVGYSGSPFSPPSSPYTYEWFKDGLPFSSMPFDTVIDNLVQGNYSVIITDSIGCTDSVGSHISQPDELIFDTIYNTDINCRGVNQGSFFCSVSGGKRYMLGSSYDYYLINLNLGDTVSIITRDSLTLTVDTISTMDYDVVFNNLYAGEYILNVVDSSGCVIDIIFEIMEPVEYIVFGSTTDILICESDSSYLKIDSVLVDSLLGSQHIAFGFAYDSINGVHVDSIYSSSGWHDIYVYDSIYFCLDTVSVKWESLYEINIFETITHISCFGNQSGSVIIDSITGGNAPYDIQWGGVDNTNLFSGIYLLNIVDSIGCVREEQYEIVEPDQINTNAVFYPSACQGLADGSITIDPQGGVGQLTYFWLNGTGTVDSLYSLVDGIYYLIVEDSLCTDTLSFSLQSPQSLHIDVTFDSVVSCPGALTLVDVIISGGTYPYFINWNDGDSVNTSRVLESGFYEIQVLDSNGCMAADSITILEPNPLEVMITYTEMSCNQGGTSIVSASGGVPPYSYLWNTGDTIASIDSLWELTYWVLVTDSCGTSFADTVYLNYYDLNVAIYYDDSAHIAEAEVENLLLTGPFDYVWLNVLGDTIGVTSVSPILCEGTYFLVTTDLANNCSVIDTFSVSFYLPIGVLDINTTTVYEDSSLWGAAPYTYVWSNGETSQHANICPGNHWVEVIDANNCLVREDFTIESLLISLDPASAILECNLENLDIDLEASAIGGVSPYSFEWWNGSKDNPINLGLSPGDYSVSVTDANGCIEDTSFVILTMTSECIPNVFTPNNDNVNDSWSLEDTFLYEDSEVSVYGRFGRLVFHSVGYHDQWDGTNKKGNDMPSGVYFYSIEIGHGFDQIKGTVTILR